MTNEKNCWKQTMMKKGLSWNHQTVFMSEPHSETSHSIRSCITHMIFPLDRVSGFKTLCQLQQWPSIHVRISILNFWPKTVGLQFTPRNDNHSLQILIWFSRPYETNHVSHPPCLNTWDDATETYSCWYSPMFFSFVFIILLPLGIDLRVLCPLII